MIGWDVTALGLPASDRPFVAGRFTQSIELPGRWLERGTVRGDDPALLDSPLGWAGQRILATLWFAAGEALAPARRDALLDAARAVADAHPLGRHAGSTAVDRRRRGGARAGAAGRAGDGPAGRGLARLAAAGLAARGGAAARLADLSRPARRRRRDV